MAGRYTAEGELDYEGTLPEGHKLGWSAAFGEQQLLVSATHPVAAPGGTGGQLVLHDVVMSFEPGKAPAVLSDLPRDEGHPPPALWRWNHREAWLVDWVDHPAPGEARVRALDARGGTELVRVTPRPSWLAFHGDGEMIYGRVLFSQQHATEIVVQPLRSQAVRAVP